METPMINSQNINLLEPFKALYLLLFKAALSSAGAAEDL
jgi:hypothetical protein